MKFQVWRNNDSCHFHITYNNERRMFMVLPINITTFIEWSNVFPTSSWNLFDLFFILITTSVLFYFLIFPHQHHGNVELCWRIISQRRMTGKWIWAKYTSKLLQLLKMKCRSVVWHMTCGYLPPQSKKQHA